MPTRIDRLTEAQRARFEEWTDRWIAVGLRTGEADWERFEASAKKCYEYAGISWPGVVVRVPSPVVGAFAAPIASYVLRKLAVRDGAVGGAVRDAVRGAVDGAVGGAVRDAVGGAVDGAWYYRLGGQLWPGFVAWTSFFREVCHLELPGDVWQRALAYEGTVESASWWWPHERFVMVCDRPKAIHLEQVRPRGWGSHRLHSVTGPAIAWEGWELYFVHGIRVDPKVVTAPETLTVREVLTQRNAEVSRVMIERLGADRLFQLAASETGHGDAVGVFVLHEDHDQLGHPRRLLRLPLRDDEDLVMVQVTNSTREPDGSWKSYMLRVPPATRTCAQGIAWTFGHEARDYAPAAES